MEWVSKHPDLQLSKNNRRVALQTSKSIRWVTCVHFMAQCCRWEVFRKMFSCEQPAPSSWEES
eukprot:2266677-Pyramimonas_sp.AAC.1